MLGVSHQPKTTTYGKEKGVHFVTTACAVYLHNCVVAEPSVRPGNSVNLTELLIGEDPQAWQRRNVSLYNNTSTGERGYHPTTMSKTQSNGYWVLDTRGVDPTLVIGMSFIFISYFLHPIVESAYKRARACSAWRTIGKGQSVEVTSYPMMAEIFGARGNWDAGRITTILLALFSLVSWGLELSIGVANIEDLPRVPNQSPAVEVGTIDGLDVWLVRAYYSS